MFLFFQVKVDENGKIVDAKFKTFGCGSAIASSSLATEWVKGKSVISFSIINFSINFSKGQCFLQRHGYKFVLLFSNSAFVDMSAMNT